MKHGVPNIGLQQFDRFGWERIKILRQSHHSCQIQGWLTGHISFEFRLSKPIPNIVWHYSKFVVYLEEKVHWLQQFSIQLKRRLIKTD